MRAWERVAGKARQPAGGGPRSRLSRVLDALRGARHRVRRLHVREGLAHGAPAEPHEIAHDAPAADERLPDRKAAPVLRPGVPQDARPGVARLRGGGRCGRAPDGRRGSSAGQRVHRGPQAQPSAEPRKGCGGALAGVGAARPGRSARGDRIRPAPLTSESILSELTTGCTAVDRRHTRADIPCQSFRLYSSEQVLPASSALCSRPSGRCRVCCMGACRSLHAGAEKGRCRGPTPRALAPRPVLAICGATSVEGGPDP
mmetsp:Transcript_129217/g.359842  ORF Transcript_129217/g.359842 Transcript_129217/m.359842 type:complete len:258 (+) Transcript_129217:318-1091(+)